ncbi:hypothetical protein HDU78_001850 [Chytriomyces hyalinus]|nr:hypothetical protein HDU78_001850 [Chytriomyces hyalinus]
MATCAAYTGGYCARFVNYPIFVPAGGSIAATEAVLKAGGMDLLLSLNASTPADRPCVTAFVESVCYASYPSCKNSAIVDVPCLSVCEKAVSECTSLFTMFGKVKSLPNCAGTVVNFNVPYSTSNTCLGYKSAAIEAPPQPPAGPISPYVCPSFLIKHPAYNDSNPKQELPTVHGQNCIGPCCVPCPILHQFYDPDQISAFNIWFQGSSLVSFLGALFCSTSYIIFGHRRVHPGRMMMLFSFGMTLFHSCQIMGLGSNGYRITCQDSITESHFENGAACSYQAFMLVFSGLYTIFWINTFMFNLYLQLVWRKDWFGEKYPHLLTFSILYSAIPAVIMLANKDIANTGFTCLSQVDTAMEYMLYPLAFVGWPGTICMLFTVTYLVYILIQAPGNKTSTNTNTKGTEGGSMGNKADPQLNKTASKSDHNLANVSSKLEKKLASSQSNIADPPTAATPTSPTTPSINAAKSKPGTVQDSLAKAKARVQRSRARTWGVIQKSWRSIALCTIMGILFGSFWSTTVLMVRAFKGVGQDTPWLQGWFACAMQGNSQAECAQTVAEHVPSLSANIMQMCSSLLGFFIFIIFGGQFKEDWVKMIWKK